MTQDFSTSFRNNVLSYCRRWRMFETCRGGAVIVGLSGGADSVCLLHTLVSLKKELDIQPAAAHLNHSTRGAESDADAAFARDFATSLDVPFHSTQIGVDAPEPPVEGSPEERWRIARRQFLINAMHEAGASRVALAHNMDDQAETVLMRLITGSSPDGMAAIRPVSEHIVRPLLSCTRADIERYCAENDLEFRHDSSNDDTRFSRNRVRHELIPFVENEFNPRVKERLASFADLMREDAEFFKAAAKEALDRAVCGEEEGHSISLARTELEKLPVPVLGRVMLAAVMKLGGDSTRPASSHISSLCDLFRSGHAGKTVLFPGGISAKLKYETVELVIGGGDAHNKDTGLNHLSIEAEELDFDPAMLKNKDSMIAYLDAEKVVGDIVVRTKREGDRFRPLGMKNEKKLSDFFVDEKVNPENREAAPVVEIGGRIAWIAGYRMDDSFRIVPGKTRRVIRLVAVREENS